MQRKKENTYGKKMSEKCFVALFAMVLLLATAGLAMADYEDTITDPEGDVTYIHEHGLEYNVERPNIDITLVEMSESHGDVTVSLTVKGTIMNSSEDPDNRIVYNVQLADGEGGDYLVSYDDGDCSLLVDSSGGITALEPEANGVGTSTLSVSFLLDDIFNPDFLEIVLAGTFDYIDGEEEYYVDTAENGDTDPDNGNGDTDPDNGNGDTDPDNGNGEANLTTYAGYWEGTAQGVPVSGIWEFDVDFDNGTIEGWADGDLGYADVEGTVSDGVVDAEGEAGAGTIEWTGEFTPDQEDVSGDWSFKIEAYGSGTWSGSLGDADDLENGEVADGEEEDYSGIVDDIIKRGMICIAIAAIVPIIVIILVIVVLIKVLGKDDKGRPPQQYQQTQQYPQDQQPQEGRIGGGDTPPPQA